MTLFILQFYQVNQVNNLDDTSYYRSVFAPVGTMGICASFKQMKVVNHKLKLSFQLVFF